LLLLLLLLLWHRFQQLHGAVASDLATHQQMQAEGSAALAETALTAHHAVRSHRLQPHPLLLLLLLSYRLLATELASLQEVG
jgi:hypothetical protein